MLKRFIPTLGILALCASALVLGGAPAGSATTSSRAAHHSERARKVRPALAGLLPPVAKACAPLKQSFIPPGLVGLVDAVYCYLPKLGSSSYLYAYLFDSASDYRASLNIYNQYKEIAPPTPGVGCPNNSGDNGVDAWSNKTFPKRSGQMLECRMEANAGKGLLNIPDYVWTVPTKDTILEVFGNPGSSMGHLDAWWLANADTGVLLRS